MCPLLQLQQQQQQSPLYTVTSPAGSASSSMQVASHLAPHQRASGRGGGGGGGGGGAVGVGGVYGEDPARLLSAVAASAAAMTARMMSLDYPRGVMDGRAPVATDATNTPTAFRSSGRGNTPVTTGVSQYSWMCYKTPHLLLGHRL